MPTTEPPMAIAATSLQLSASSKPVKIPTKIQIQVPVTPAQIGQIFNICMFRRNIIILAIKNIDIVAIIIIFLNQEDYNSQSDHCQSADISHVSPFPVLKSHYFFCYRFIAGNHKNQNQGRNKDQIIQNQITETPEIRGLIVQKTQYHQIRSAGAGKFAQTD